MPSPEVLLPHRDRAAGSYFSPWAPGYAFPVSFSYSAARVLSRYQSMTLRLPMYGASVRRSSSGRPASEGIRYSNFRRLGKMLWGSGDEKYRKNHSSLRSDPMPSSAGAGTDSRGLFTVQSEWHWRQLLLRYKSPASRMNAGLAVLKKGIRGPV